MVVEATAAKRPCGNKSSRPTRYAVGLVASGAIPASASPRGYDRPRRITRRHAMGLIQDFTGNPDQFLKDNAIVVGDQTEHGGSQPPGVANFFMKRGKQNVVYLERKSMVGPKDVLKAYWLPWKSKTGVPLTLGTEAEWLFTSGMTNCRFSVLSNSNDVAIKVAHVAGDLNSSQKRTDWEEGAGSGFVTDKSTQRVRRMSRSGAELHQYLGQGKSDDDSSTAFVFGHYESGEWKFYAQVIKGFRTVENTTFGLASNIEILSVKSPLSNLPVAN